MLCINSRVLQFGQIVVAKFYLLDMFLHANFTFGNFALFSFGLFMGKTYVWYCYTYTVFPNFVECFELEHLKQLKCKLFCFLKFGYIFCNNSGNTTCKLTHITKMSNLLSVQRWRFCCKNGWSDEWLARFFQKLSQNLTSNHRWTRRTVAKKEVSILKLIYPKTPKYAGFWKKFLTQNLKNVLDF